MTPAPSPAHGPARPLVSRGWVCLLSAKSVSTLGSRLTVAALPLVAIQAVHADALKMGLLEAAALLPNAVLSPFAGAFVDRHSKRGILVLANLLSGLTLLAIAGGAQLQRLSFVGLAGLALAAAVFAMADELALFSLIPSIVPKEGLAVANVRFRTTTAGARMAGAAAAGVLIAAAGAAGAMAADGLTFFAAALLIALVPASGAPAEDAGAPGSYLQSVRAGVGFILARSDFVLIVGAALVVNFLGATFDALSALFLVRDLGLPGAWYAAALTAGTVAGVAGAFLSARASRVLEMPALLAAGVALVGFGLLAVSLLHGAPLQIALVFGACCATNAFGSILVSTALGTLLQQRTPPAMLGGVAGLFTALMSGIAPTGAIAGGALGGLVGLRPTLVAAAIAMLAVAVLVGLAASLMPREEGRAA